MRGRPRTQTPEIAQPRWCRASYRDRLPHRLGDLTGPAQDKVDLPLHIVWSGLNSFDLEQPKTRMSLYRVVLAAFIRSLDATLAPESTRYARHVAERSSAARRRGCSQRPTTRVSPLGALVRHTATGPGGIGCRPGPLFPQGPGDPEIFGESRDPQTLHHPSRIAPGR